MICFVIVQIVDEFETLLCHLLQLTTELLRDCRKPAVIKAVGEASSLAVEWSHDVCQHLLSALSCLELSSKKATPRVKLKKTSGIDAEFGRQACKVYLGLPSKSVDHEV